MDLVSLLFIVPMFIVVILLVKRRNIHGYIRKYLAWRQLPHIPYPAYPLVGHTYLLPSEPTAFFQFISDLAINMIEKKKSRFWLQWMGPLPLITVCHPETVEVLLKSSKHTEKSFVYRFLHPWLGTGLLTSSGNKWNQRRRLITPAFHFHILEDFLDVMNEQSEKMLKILKEKIASNDHVDIAKIVKLCALDIICETAMGQTVNAQIDEDSKYVRAVSRMTKIVQERQKKPALWWDYMFKRMRMGKEHEKLLQILHGFTRHVIEKNMQSDKKIKRRMAFMNVLIHAKTENGESLSFSDIQEEADTFMFEGHDTSASAITWCLYLLGRHPDVQQRVHDEISDVIGDVRSLKTEELKNLIYLEKVIKETLRLYPPVPLIGRVTTEDCFMDGYMIPKGTETMTIVYSLHRNPEVWEDPLRFDPERFSTERCAKRHPFAYIPFSAGPRNCIGQKFAMMEEKVILTHLLSCYRIRSHDREDIITVNGDMILHPSKPLLITLEKRN